MIAAFKFSGDFNGEIIFKIGQYLTKLCVDHLGFTFLAHPVHSSNGWHTTPCVAFHLTFQATVVETGWTWDNAGDGMDKRDRPWLPWMPGQIFKLSKNLPRQPLPRCIWETQQAVVKRGERNKTWQYVTVRNKTRRRSIVGREACVFPGISRSFQVLSRSVAFSTRFFHDSHGYSLNSHSSSSSIIL